MGVDRFNPGISVVYQPVSGAKLSFLSDLFAVRTESDFRAWLFEGKPADVDTSAILFIQAVSIRYPKKNPVVARRPGVTAKTFEK